jgi:hypothetical protein
MLEYRAAAIDLLGDLQSKLDFVREDTFPVHHE